MATEQSVSSWSLCVSKATLTDIVLRKKNALKQARVKDSDASDGAQCANLAAIVENSIAVAREQFCALLDEDKGSGKVCLQARGDDLLRLHDRATTDQFLCQYPSVSLAYMLSTYSLTPRMKLVLAFTLAHSVWQFYASDWMKSGWTCESVQFLVEKTGLESEGVHAGKPCLFVKFHDIEDGLPECTAEADMIHKYPRVLALGMLLLHIVHHRYRRS
jgi:hypothetical protein